MTIRTDGHTSHELPARYLDAGHVRYGYALTIHKSQGITVDRCLVLASDTLDRQAGYTALSHGRNDNRIYLVAQPPTDPETHHPEREHPDPNAATRERAPTRPDRTPRDRPPDRHRPDPPRPRTPLPRPCSPRGQPALASPDRKADIRALQDERHQLRNTVEREQRFLDTKRPVLHRRQHNVARLAAERGPRPSHRRNPPHRNRARTSPPRPIRRDTHNHNSLDEIRVIDYAIGDRLDKLVDTIAHHPPDYLQQLGPRPADPTDRHDWNNIVRDIEAYRTKHDITDERDPLGARPTTSAELHTWTRLVEQYATTAAELDPTQTQHRGRSLDRSIGIEL